MSNEDKNIEKIKRLLQEKLGASQESDWNVPSDQVWAGLSDELQANRQTYSSNSRIYLILAVFTALCSMLLLRECSHQTEVSELRMELEQLKHSFQELEKNCGQKNSAVPPSPSSLTQPLSQNTSFSSSDQVVKGQNNSATASIHPLKTIAKPLAVIPFDNNEKAPASILTPGQSYQTLLAGMFNRDESPITIERLSKAIGLGLRSPVMIDKARLLALQQLENESILPAIQLYIPKLTNNKNSRLIYLASLQAGVTFGNNHLIGEKPSIITQQQALLGFYSGLGLETAFNRHWSLSAGMQYASSRTATNYQLAVPYTQMNEYLHTDGNFDNQYNHSLPSSLGDYPAQLVLTRQNTSSVEEGEVMNLDLAIEQSTHLLRFPLYLRYGLGKKAWQAGIKSGLIANRVLDIQAEASSLVSHHGAIHHRHTNIGNPVLNDLQRTTLDAGIGIDIRYAFAPKWQLSLEMTHQRGLTPVYKNQLVKNRLKTTNIGLFVLRSF